RALPDVRGSDRARARRAARLRRVRSEDRRVRLGLRSRAQRPAEPPRDGRIRAPRARERAVAQELLRGEALKAQLFVGRGAGARYSETNSRSAIQVKSS